MNGTNFFVEVTVNTDGHERALVALIAADNETMAESFACLMECFDSGTDGLNWESPSTAECAVTNSRIVAQVKKKVPKEHALILNKYLPCYLYNAELLEASGNYSEMLAAQTVAA